MSATPAILDGRFGGSAKYPKRALRAPLWKETLFAAMLHIGIHINGD